MRKERVVGFSNKIQNIKWVNWYAMHCGADGWWRSEDDPKSPIWPYPYWVARRRLRIYIIQWNILMKYHNCLCSSSVGVRDDEPQTIRIRKWLCCCCCWCTPTSNSVFNCFVCVCDRVFTFLFYYFCLFIIIIFFPSFVLMYDVWYVHKTHAHQADEEPYAESKCTRTVRAMTTTMCRMKIDKRRPPANSIDCPQSHSTQHTHSTRACLYYNI